MRVNGFPSSETYQNGVVNRKGMKFLHERAVLTREVKNLTGRIVRESIPISSQADVLKLQKLAKFVCRTF